MSKSLFLQIIRRSALATFAMLLVWFSLNNGLNGHIWDGMTVSKSALTVEYCEFNDTSRLFHQCMNTYSNLCYFFFGILICQIAFFDYTHVGQNLQNRLAQFPLLSALMGVCFIYLSFGSALFHASLTWIGQRVDMNGTYSITIAALGIGFYHVFHKIMFSERQKIGFVIGLILMVVVFLDLHLRVSSSILLPVMILFLWVFTAINYFQFRKERSILLAVASLVFIVIALKIRTLDVQKIGCDPYSLYQGHALWHLLTGLSSFCGYAFYRLAPQ
jgi:Ceramidase